jgi:hypothetical protein
MLTHVTTNRRCPTSGSVNQCMHVSEELAEQTQQITDGLHEAGLPSIVLVNTKRLKYGLHETAWSYQALYRSRSEHLSGVSTMRAMENLLIKGTFGSSNYVEFGHSLVASMLLLRGGHPARVLWDCK